MKKWVLLLLALAVVAGAAYGVRQSGIDVVALVGLKNEPIAGGGGKQAAQGQGNRGPSPVETAKAISKTLSDDISAIGNLLAEETVSIAPETSGRVAEILFDDGQGIAAGAPLFKLDSDLAQAALAEAKARLSLAEANYGRNQTLRKSGNVAQSTYDASLTELEVARTALESAQVKLDKLTITAPFSGILGFKTVSVGAYVNAGTPLVQLDKIDHLRVSFSVPELEYGRIAVGQIVEVVADALPDVVFTATIVAVDPSVDVNGRALQVRADLDNRGLKLRPGLLVRITVKGKARDAVLVPESAIVQRGEAAFVYVVRDQKVEEVKVRVGRRLTGMIEIVEGVEAGADVVVAGNTGLSDGTAIEVVAAAAPTQTE